MRPIRKCTACRQCFGHFSEKSLKFFYFNYFRPLILGVIRGKGKKKNTSNQQTHLIIGIKNWKRWECRPVQEGRIPWESIGSRPWQWCDTHSFWTRQSCRCKLRKSRARGRIRTENRHISLLNYRFSITFEYADFLLDKNFLLLSRSLFLPTNEPNARKKGYLNFSRLHYPTK